MGKKTGKKKGPEIPDFLRQKVSRPFHTRFIPPAARFIPRQTTYSFCARFNQYFYLDSYLWQVFGWTSKNIALHSQPYPHVISLLKIEQGWVSIHRFCEYRGALLGYIRPYKGYIRSYKTFERPLKARWGTEKKVP